CSIRFARFGWGVRKSGKGALALAGANGLEPLAERHDRGDHLDVAEPGDELRHLALDERLGPVRLATALAEVRVDDLLEIVDVVAVHVVARADGGPDAARHRDGREAQKTAKPT